MFTNVTEGKFMTAKYAGRCEKCGAWMEAGTEIWYAFDTRKASHADVVVCGDARIAHPPVAPDTSEMRHRLPDGHYTVVFGPHDDDYYTFDVTWHTDGKFAGMAILSYLYGPDNESDYLGFAFIKSDGKLAVWKRYGADSALADAARVLLNPDAAEAAGMAYAMKSGRCRNCGRTLTVPTSLHRGYGPDCFAKLGLA